MTVKNNMNIIKEEIYPLAKRLYKSYGEYVNTNKMIVSYIDGLLPVQRRILLTLHEIANKDFVKTAKILGSCMSSYHPHSDAWGTTIYLVQNKLALGGGQWGNTYGIEPIGASHFRYTKIKMCPSIEEMAFSLINYVEREESELDPEPKNLPTLFPFCFLTDSIPLSMIGFGFKSDIPSYKMEDLFKRLNYLLDKNNKEYIPKPLIRNCDILSKKEEIKNLIENGEGSISYKGQYKADEKNNRLYILGWNPRIKFKALLNKISKYNGYNLVENGDIIIRDESTESTGTNIVVEVNRSRNVKDVYDKMLEAVDNSMYFTLQYRIYSVQEDNSIRITSVDEMLLNCYKFYKKTYKIYLDESIKKLDSIKYEYNILDKLKPYISKASSEPTFDESVDKLVSLSKCSKEDILTVLNKYKIKSIMSIKTDTTKIESEIKKYKEELKNIRNVVLDNYKKLL